MRPKHIYLAVFTLAAVTLQAEAKAQEEAADEHHVIDEIIVEAAPLPRSVLGLTQPTAVISGDDLTRKQSASIGETIADELGVNSTYFGPIASRPVIRGQYGERILMLSNGLSALDASALSEDHAVSLDSALADRVEIVRGPATLLYGSGASGGIVNIVDSRIYRDPLPNNFAGAVKLGTDSALGKESAAIKLAFGNENVIGHVDYMTRSTDDIEIPGFAESAILRALEEEEGGEEEEEQFGTVENTDSETDSGAAALTLRNDRGYIGLSVSMYETEYGVPGAHAHEEEEPGPGEPPVEEEEEIIRIDMEQTRYDLRGEYAFDSFIENVSFKLARNDYEHVELEGEEVGTLYENTGTDLRLELQHGGLLTGAFGLQYKLLEFDAVGDEAFVPPSDTTQLALFAFEEWAVNEAWTLQGSARIERQEIDAPGLPDYDETAGGFKLGAIWSFNPNWNFAGNLSISERHPNSTELYARGPHLAVQRFELGSVIQGDGILDKELSQNLDLTLRAGYDRFEFSVTGFVNNVDDYIFLDPTIEVEDGLQVFNFVQADAELYGFEAEALFELYEQEQTHFHVRVYSDYTRGELADGGNLPRIPPLRYGLSLHYRYAGFDAAVSATRVDEQDETVIGELPTDAYTMVDAEASYRFDNPNVYLFLRGTNLGDEDARRHSSPLKDFVPLPGRSLVAGLRWDF